VFAFDSSVPAELVPLSWLIGVWEGTGVIDYGVDAADGSGPRGHRTAELGQRLSFSHDGLPHLGVGSASWVLPAPGDARAGPGMLPGVGPRPYATADEVEALRNADGGFDIEVAIVHPTGVSEFYLGQVKGPRIDLGTDAVVRSETAKHYAAATRLYGLVEGHLLWAWDMAALGQDLRTHASARLARVD